MEFGRLNQVHGLRQRLKINHLTIENPKLSKIFSNSRGVSWT